MSERLVPALLSAVLASALTGGLMVILGPGSGPPAAVDTGLAAEVAALGRAAQALGDQQLETARQLQLLRLDVLAATTVDDALPGSGPVEPLTASQQDLATLREQVAALDSKLRESDAGPVDVESVSAALDQLRAKEDEERRVQWAERRDERVQERLATLTKELGLDAYQQERMQAVMTDADVRRDEIMQKARDEGGGFDAMRESFDGLRAEIQTSVAQFLSPTQITTLDGLGGLSGWDRGRRGGPGFDFGGRRDGD